MQPFSRSSVESHSPTWLTVFVSGSAILLLLDLAGLRLPVWSLCLVNPIAWVSDLTGLTKLAPGFLIGVDEGVQSLAALIGIPVVGSFFVWFLISLSWPRMRVLHLLSVVVGGSVALQFTMQRAYLSMADYYEARNDFKRASAALEKVLYVAHMTDSPGVLKTGETLVGSAMRLARLEGQLAVADSRYPEVPIQFRVANVTVTMKSDHQPLQYPRLAGNSAWYRSFTQTLTQILTNNDFDLKSFEHLNVLDLRLLTGMSIASTLGIQRRIIMPRYKEEAARLLSEPLALTVRIHRSLEDLTKQADHGANEILAAPGGDNEGKIKAFYDRRYSSLHIAVPDKIYRDKVVEQWTGYLEKGLSLGEASINAATFLTDTMHAPVVHELWHFAAHNIPFFEGLPAALEEGMAIFFQFIQESMSETENRYPELMEGIARGKYRDGEREKYLASKTPHCSKGAEQYRNAILSADRSGTLVPTRVLLGFSSASLHARPDVELLYAEGWALFTRIGFDKTLFWRVRKHASRLSAAGLIESPQEREFWDDLDREMVEFPTIFCSGG